MQQKTHTDGYRSPGEVTMSELFPNHDGLRPLAVNDLVGRTVDIRFEDGTAVAVNFKEGKVDLHVSKYGSWFFLGGEIDCEVIPVRDNILAAAVNDARTNSSYVLVLDFPNSRVLAVHTQILPGPSGIGERTSFVQGSIGGAPFEKFGLTKELVGKRVYWQYSESHQFEHIYIEPNRYCWHGIKGPEAGMGGVEPASAYKIADQLYLFSWSDTSVAFNGTILINLRGDVSCGGRLYGWERAEERGWQLVIGARGQILNETTYPNQ
jgi:hypothetical protein